MNYFILYEIVHFDSVLLLEHIVDDISHNVCLKSKMASFP